MLRIIARSSRNIANRLSSPVSTKISHSAVNLVAPVLASASGRRNASFFSSAKTDPDAVKASVSVSSTRNATLQSTQPKAGMMWSATHSFAVPVPASASMTATGMLTLSQLQQAINDDTIDTVVVGITDLYGRFVGKRFDAQYFVDICSKSGTHACAYLLTCDMDMKPTPGFAFANWERGYGDFHVCPDLSTLRVAAWLDKTAVVIADAAYETGVEVNKSHSPSSSSSSSSSASSAASSSDGHDLVAVSPRTILLQQLSRAKSLGFGVLAATELEFYLFETGYREARKLDYRKGSLVSSSDYVEDYHTLQGAREERFNQAFRRYLRKSGVPVECSKSEAGVGQQELNVLYSDALTAADRHAVYKMCLKETADKLGGSVTFMAKPYEDATGSGCHIHINLIHDGPDGGNAFKGTEKIADAGRAASITCSPLFKQFVAGLIKYTPETMVFLAPTINSYKRFANQSWAPTRLAWALDNRTAGFRVVGSGNSLRIEVRIPGSDVNPYLAIAASIASGLQGIEERLVAPALFEGDVYEAPNLALVPQTLRDSIRLFRDSTFARSVFGQDVVDHYAHFYTTEANAYSRAVTDWERHRYFEQI